MSKLGIYAIAALVLLAALWGWGQKRYNDGQEATQVKWDKSVSKGKVEIDKLKEAAGKITTVVETQYVDRIKTVREKGDVIVREVPVYVPAGACVLPGGFRVLHDAAAEGSLPDPAAVPDAASVDAQAVASTVAGNYGTCHETETRLTSLQDWVKQQKAANP